MSDNMRQKRPRRKGGIGSRVWSILNTIISSIFLTISVLLILVALSEILVYLIDTGVNRSGTYLDWWGGPLVIFLSSLPFLAFHLALRLNLLSRLRGRMRKKAPPKKIDTIDLD